MFYEDASICIFKFNGRHTRNVIMEHFPILTIYGYITSKKSFIV